MSYTIRLPTLHAGQQRMLDESERFNVGCCGRRFGKSFVASDILLDGPQKKGALHGYPVGLFAPTYKVLTDHWRTINRIVKPVAARISEQDKRIELVTGGVLELWSLDDPSAGRSRRYATVVVDEVAMVKKMEEAWQQSIQPTLMDFRGDAWFFSTPKGIAGPGAFFKDLFDRGRDGSTKMDGWKSWQMPTSVNPKIHPDEIETMRREMPELVFQQEVLAQFVDFGGTVVKREWLRVGQPPELSTLRIFMGVDLAISMKEEADFTAIAVLGVSEDGRIWLLFVDRKRVTFHDTLTWIREVAQRFRPQEVGIESVQYQAAVVQELLRTTDLPVRAVKPDKDKLTRFQRIQVRYQQSLVWHAETLPSYFEDELLSFPVGEHDDMVDALVHAYDLSGDYGRSQIILPDQDVVPIQIMRDMPGLPSDITSQILAAREGTCGRCASFSGAGACSLRGFRVAAGDAACDAYVQSE